MFICIPAMWRAVFVFVLLHVVLAVSDATVVPRYHYVAIFLVVFGGYAAMGHFLFGTTLEEFSTIGRSMMLRVACCSDAFTAAQLLTARKPGSHATFQIHDWLLENGCRGDRGLARYD